MHQRKLFLFIAMSLDGYIARKDGDIDWLSTVEKKGEDYGYQKFINQIDTLIMGRKTYDKVLSFGIPFPHADKKCYIITRSDRPSEENIHFYNGDLEILIQQIRKEAGKHIYCDGGAEIVHALMQKGLIDEFIISIIPIFLGDGIRLFKNNTPETTLELVAHNAFETGLIQLHYRKKQISKG